MSWTKEKIGIVGVNGDLGSRLANQSMLHGYEVVGYDLVQRSIDHDLCVDPAVSHTEETVVDVAETVDELYEHTDIVHWCMPALDVIGVAEDVSPNAARHTVSVLHDSVMQHSVNARDRLPEYITDSTAIVHCLVNSEKSVINMMHLRPHERVATHFVALGLRPVPMVREAHDRLMAKTQAIMALFCDSEVSWALERGDELGLLTPSARELLDAVRTREANWTDATVQSLLSNPYLEAVVNSVLDSKQLATR